MNYSESQTILEEIKKAKKILLNCHRGPDPDGIGSTMAMKTVLEGMDLKYRI
jgi:nanoRNase/pAp phosphatase (c-di-AMP/oligoRNAs hydrolase)